MHRYSHHGTMQRTIPLFLATVSMALTFAVFHAVKALSIQSPWWLTLPGVMTVYVALYNGFDRYAWKWAIFRKIGLVSVPLLEGEWEVEMKSSFDDFKKKYHGKVVVTQTWTRMLITYSGDGSSADRSSSISVTASVRNIKLPAQTLYYVFENKPVPGAAATMVPHVGVAILDYLEGKDALEGEYFNGRGRETHGPMSWTRQPR